MKPYDCFRGISPVTNISAFIGLSLIIGWFMIMSKLPNSVFKAPAPKTLDIENAVFRRSCYDYEHVTAVNKCCKMKQYNFPAVEACARAFTRSKRAQNSAHSNLTEPLHIVLVGDSHMRFILAALSLSLENSRLVDKQKEWQEWVEVKKGIPSLMKSPPGLDIQVTFHMDLFHQSLPSLMKLWEDGNYTKPSIVLIDSGLHHMVRYPHPQAVPYKRALVKIVPYLTQLASSVPVFYKLIDDLLAARTGKFKMSQSRTELYNNIARQVLQGTGVHIWDSTLPLSVLYNDECEKRKQETPPLYEWRCSDTRHLGYIAVQQFANMIYNSVCNKYMNLPDGYCK